MFAFPIQTGAPVQAPQAAATLQPPPSGPVTKSADMQLPCKWKSNDVVLDKSSGLMYVFLDKELHLIPTMDLYKAIGGSPTAIPATPAEIESCKIGAVLEQGNVTGRNDPDIASRDGENAANDAQDDFDKKIYVLRHATTNRVLTLDIGGSLLMRDFTEKELSQTWTIYLDGRVRSVVSKGKWLAENEDCMAITLVDLRQEGERFVFIPKTNGTFVIKGSCGYVGVDKKGSLASVPAEQEWHVQHVGRVR